MENKDYIISCKILLRKIEFISTVNTFVNVMESVHQTVSITFLYSSVIRTASVLRFNCNQMVVLAVKLAHKYSQC